MKFIIPKDIPAISWSWSEGKYWDMWMIVHALSGAICGCAAAWFGMPAMYAYPIGLLVLTAWEIGEMIAGVKEELTNWVLDIVFGMIGFWFAYHEVFSVTSEYEIGAIGALLFLLNSFFSYLGWRAYRKRTA